MEDSKLRRVPDTDSKLVIGKRGDRSTHLITTDFIPIIIVKETKKVNFVTLWTCS